MKKKIILWTAVLICMAGIFCLSAKPAKVSSKQSGAITKIVNNAVKKLPIQKKAKANILKKTETYVRKTAHFTEYFVLGILVLAACLSTFNKKNFWIALIICVLYAASDEIHQMFVPGRSCRLTDVFIDASGSLTGELVFIYLRYILYVKGGYKND